MSVEEKYWNLHIRVAPLELVLRNLVNAVLADGYPALEEDGHDELRIAVSEAWMVLGSLKPETQP